MMTFHIKGQAQALFKHWQLALWDYIIYFVGWALEPRPTAFPNLETEVYAIGLVENNVAIASARMSKHPWTHLMEGVLGVCTVCIP